MPSRGPIKKSFIHKLHKLTPYASCTVIKTCRKRLYRRSKQSVPRKSSDDVHLAMKIKKLFENLEAIDLNRRAMSPRSEQKVLLEEIQKVREVE